MSSIKISLDIKMVSNALLVQYTVYHEDSQETEVCSAEGQLLFVHTVAHLIALPTL
jgi:hypothetical protein